jgi:hypothetical protein
MPDDTHMDFRERVAALEQMLVERTAERDEALDTRPRPATCSTSSAARPPMCNRCWTQLPKRPPGFAAPIPD